jgi:hypothetical protein
LNLFSCEAAQGERLPGERDTALYQSDALRKLGEITASGDCHHIPLMLRNVN